jgi:dihydroorotase
MVGFETALPLAITYLVKTGTITINKLVEKMCLNPSKLLCISKGALEVGGSADITIVDVNEEFVVEAQGFSSKSKNSPFGGMKLSGSVWSTIVGGKTIVYENTIL